MASPIETMFKAMLPAGTMEAVQAIATNGTLEKIIKFSDEAGQLRDDVREMRREIAELKTLIERMAHNGTEHKNGDGRELECGGGPDIRIRSFLYEGPVSDIIGAGPSE